MADAPTYCVLIPAYNEEKRIAEVVAASTPGAARVIVVDDGSSDTTADRAKSAGADVVLHEVNRGKGAAVATGFRRALELGYPWVIVLDADGQHDPAEIPGFFKAQEKTGADVVVGTRMTDTADMPLIRRWTNVFTSSVVSRLAGQQIPDSQSGFRLYRTKCLDGLELTTSNFDAESEILIYLARRGAKIGSTPIRTIYGDEVSKIRPIRDTIRFIGLVRTYRKRERPT